MEPEIIFHITRREYKAISEALEHYMNRECSRYDIREDHRLQLLDETIKKLHLQERGQGTVSCQNSSNVS